MLARANDTNRKNFKRPSNAAAAAYSEARTSREPMDLERSRRFGRSQRTDLTDLTVLGLSAHNPRTVSRANVFLSCSKVQDKDWQSELPSFTVSSQPQWVNFPPRRNEPFAHHENFSNAPRNRTKCRPRRVFCRSIGAILGSTTRIGCIAAVAQQLATQGTVEGRKKGALVVY